MGQLKMIFDAEATPVPLLNMPHGFSLHAVSPAECGKYLAFRQTINWHWQEQDFVNYQAKILPDGLFVMIDDATGKFAASAGAETSDFKDHPEIAVLGWVLTDPMYKGHHLGKNVSIAAMHKCLSLGYRRISLLTDDFRIPALKTYLGLGWQPWLYENDMPERWAKITANLKITCDSMRCLPKKPYFFK